VDAGGAEFSKPGGRGSSTGADELGGGGGGLVWAITGVAVITRPDTRKPGKSRGANRNEGWVMLSLSAKAEDEKGGTGLEGLA